MQKSRSRFLVPGLGGLALLGLAVAIGATASGQDRAVRKDAQRDAEGADLVLVFPGGQREGGILELTAMTPAEVPVGQSFDYQIRVRNISSNLVLEDVAIHQTTPDGFTIERSSIEGSSSGSHEQGKAQTGDQPKSDQPKPDRNGDEQARKPQGNDQSDNESGEPRQAGRRGRGHWTIDRLAPGESRTIRATATGDKEGMAGTCLTVDYKPSLCIMTRFVKPEVQLSKVAPERVDLCEPIALHYTLKNTGSGPARGLTITDELPEGLKTGDGKDKVTIDVGSLAAGQSRDFDVRVVASESGEYGSRAVAEGEGDLSARSSKPTTKVVAADLAASIDGPSAVYTNQLMTYQVHVKNEGNGPATNAVLQVETDPNTRVRRISRAQPGNASPRTDGPMLTWNLGDLAPGDERTVSFTTSSSAGGEEYKHVATATAACAREGDVAKALTATTTVTTEVLTFPALVLEMVDQKDPVKVGDETVYAIAVRNQGSGADQNVQITCNLPEQFEFVGVNGTTEATADGQTITFGKLEELGPNQTASWDLHVRAKQAGDVRNKIELNSDYLHTPVPEEEPTRIIQ